MAEVKTLWFGDEKKKSMNEAIIKALTKSSILVQGQAKLLAPVDTGELRRSVLKQVYGNRLQAFVGTNTEYARWQEFGTRRMKAQPYLRPALKKNKANIKDIFRKEGGNGLRG